jgi:hypothetical protein
MSKASTAPKFVKQFVKPKDSLVLDPKIRFFKTHNNRINFINNPNLDPKIRFHNVTRDTPGFPVRAGKNRRVTSIDRAQAESERLEREKSSRNPGTSRSSVDAEDRASSQDQTPYSKSEESAATQIHHESKSAIRTLAEAFETGKRERAPRTGSSITTANMSSELTKVLAKDACPRRSNPSCAMEPSRPFPFP